MAGLMGRGFGGALKEKEFRGLAGLAKENAVGSMAELWVRCMSTGICPSARSWDWEPDCLRGRKCAGGSAMTKDCSWNCVVSYGG